MNNQVIAAYAYNPKKKIWISFEDLKTIQVKCNYVNNENLAGMMMWNIEEDYPVHSKQSLLKTVMKCI